MYIHLNILMTTTQIPSCPCFRRKLWFWDTVVLLQTLALAAGQVFAIALSSYFQLTVMLMVMVVGIILLQHFHPFAAEMSQNVQVGPTCRDKLAALLLSCSTVQSWALLQVLCMISLRAHA